MWRIPIYALALVIFPLTPRDLQSYPGSAKGNTRRYLKRYERLTLQPRDVAQGVRAKGRLKLQAGERIFDIELSRHDMRSPKYYAEEVVEGQTVRIGPVAAPNTYKGVVLGSGGVQARFRIEADSLEGVILTPEDWTYFEPMRHFDPSADPSDYVSYRLSDVEPESAGTCEAALPHRIGKTQAMLGLTQQAEASGPLLAEIATEADYEYVTALGGAVNANSEILGILNQVEGIFQTQLSITFEVTYQHAWSTSGQPYTVTNASSLLYQFTDYWNANFSAVPFDLAHLWTGKNLDGTTIGVAWLDVLCNSHSYSYGLSQRVEAPYKYTLTAHEMGHSIGASHPDLAEPPHPECAGTIMQSIVGTTLSFCPFSVDEISSFVSLNSGCLSAVFLPADPSNLAASVVSESAIDLSWQDNSTDETGFSIERRGASGADWAQVAVAGENATTYSDTGLDAGATYYYRVRATNGAGASGYSNEAVAATMASSYTLYLAGNRFSIRVDWSTLSGSSGHGIAVPLTADSGYFWFFENTNVELLVKILDGRAVNGHYWFFWGAMTDVEYTITVTDTESGAVKQYLGVQGVQRSGNDTHAF